MEAPLDDEPILPDELEQPEELQVEDRIREAPDAEEVRIRVRPLTGDFSPFLYDTEVLFRSKKVEKETGKGQIRKRGRFIPKRRKGKIVGYERRGEDVTIEAINDEVNPPIILEEGNGAPVG